MPVTLKLRDEVSLSTATSLAVICHPSPNMAADKILKLYIKENAQPRVLQDWDEVDAFYKQHLTPVRYSPKGLPIYNIIDIEAALNRENVRLPE